MSGSVQHAIRPSILQQFMQFPRQSIPRTLLVSTAASLAFFELGLRFVALIENQTSGGISRALGSENIRVKVVLILGACTGLFNVAQFRVMDYRLSRNASLAVGLSTTIVATIALSFVHGLIKVPYYEEYKKKRDVESSIHTCLSSLIAQGFDEIQLNTILDQFAEGKDFEWRNAALQQFNQVIDTFQETVLRDIDTSEKKRNLLQFIIDQTDPSKPDSQYNQRFKLRVDHFMILILSRHDMLEPILKGEEPPSF